MYSIGTVVLEGGGGGKRKEETRPRVPLEFQGLWSTRLLRLDLTTSPAWSAYSAEEELKETERKRE